MEHVRAYVEALRQAAITFAVQGQFDPARQTEIEDAVLFNIWREGLIAHLQTFEPGTLLAFKAMPSAEQARFFEPGSVYDFGRFKAEFFKSALKNEGHRPQ